MSQSKHILLLSHKGLAVSNASSSITLPNIKISTGTNINDVRSVLARHKIDHVFMGAGIEIEKRLEIVEEIYANSDTATVHLRDVASGQQGFLKFVNVFLKGLEGMDEK